MWLNGIRWSWRLRKAENCRAEWCFWGFVTGIDPFLLQSQEHRLQQLKPNSPWLLSQQCTKHKHNYTFNQVWRNIDAIKCCLYTLNQYIWLSVTLLSHLLFSIVCTTPTTVLRTVTGYKQNTGFFCHVGRALERAVFSDYLERACSVLYYSCGSMHAHDPATHLALFPVHLAVSEGLIKHCWSSGPSPSTALSSAALLLLKNHKNCKILLLNFTLEKSTSQTVKAKWQTPSSYVSITTCLLFWEKASEWSGAPIDTHRYMDQIMSNVSI